MRLLCQIFLGAQLCVLFLASAPAAADHAVVLVARSDSPIETVDPLDVRKLYLGFSVRAENDLSLRAATNQSENKLFEIFLQDVMAMSARSYDRRLLTLTLQSGRRRPDIYRNVAELIDALRGDPSLMSFMWQEDFEKAGDLKVLRVIWKE